MLIQQWIFRVQLLYFNFVSVIISVLQYPVMHSNQQQLYMLLSPSSIVWYFPNVVTPCGWNVCLTEGIGGLLPGISLTPTVHCDASYNRCGYVCGLGRCIHRLLLCVVCGKYLLADVKETDYLPVWQVGIKRSVINTFCYCWRLNYLLITRIVQQIKHVYNERIITATR